MMIIFAATLMILLAAMILAFALQGGFRKSKRQAKGFWRRLLIRQALLLPVYVLVLLPAIIGFAGSLMVGTRPDERAYVGPLLTANGSWQIQTRTALVESASLTTEQRKAIDARTLRIHAGDGHHLRAFYLNAATDEARAIVLLVHGLFRSAMELESVSSMFRELGCDVMLLELSCHGGSDRRAFTFGLRETEDVLAAVDHLRQREGGIDKPLLLFGVSLGSLTAMRAAPRIPELKGLCLDAPVFDLVNTAHGMLGSRQTSEGSRGAGMPRFFVSLTLYSIECWSGFDMAELNTEASLAALPEDVACLVIGAGLDHKVPTDSVRRGFKALAAPADRKELWIVEGTRHARVFEDRPEEYRRRLARLLERACER